MAQEATRRTTHTNLEERKDFGKKEDSKMRQVKKQSDEDDLRHEGIQGGEGNLSETNTEGRVSVTSCPI